MDTVPIPTWTEYSMIIISAIIYEVFLSGTCLSTFLNLHNCSNLLLLHLGNGDENSFLTGGVKD